LSRVTGHGAKQQQQRSVQASKLKHQAYYDSIRYGDIRRARAVVLKLFCPLRMEFTMSSTFDWADETSSEFTTRRYSSRDTIRRCCHNGLSLLTPISHLSRPSVWNSEDELPQEFTTRSGDMTASSQTSSQTLSQTSGGFLLASKVAFLAISVLGALTSGLVLAGFWLSDRSKLTPSSVLIINHTTLDRLIFSSQFPYHCRTRQFDLRIPAGCGSYPE